MAFVKETEVITLNAYLTDLGRKRLLEQGFVPTSFSISDEDANYKANNDTIDQKLPDLTGDHLDEVLSLSKSVTIGNMIIRNNSTGADINTQPGGNNNSGQTGTSTNTSNG